MRFTPRAWQSPMREHLFEHPRCALWAGMGLGKTSVVLDYISSAIMAGNSAPTLILGPLRVARTTWSSEAAKWDEFRDLSVIPIVGTETERLQALRHDAPVFTTNYDNLVWLIDHFGDRWPFQTVVADESDYIKGQRVSFRTSVKGKEFIAGQGAKRAGALARIAHTHVKQFIELTGTPAPNGLVDLWGQLWYLDRGARLGRTFEAFKNRWFTKDYDGYSVRPTAYADAQIHEAVKDICLTIRAEDWLPLDKPRINNVYVDLPPRARAMYREMEKEMFLEIEGRTSEAFNAAARTQKCLQLANGAIYLDPAVDGDDHPRAKEWKVVHDEKIDALKDIRGECGGANLLVCYEFKSDLARLLKAFPKGKALTSKTEEDFRQGKLEMLFVHPKSAGHGIDGWQNHCNNIVFFGHNWSLGQYLQVIERVGPVRQMQAGTGKIATIHHIIARGTVDELVMERRETKREVQDILLDACKRRR